MNRDIRTGLITAGLILVFALALQTLHHAGLVQGDTRELSVRGMNILMGLMIVGLANAGAKRLRRLVDLQSATLEQSLRRFTAWSLAAGGLFFAVVWLTVPYDLAIPLSAAAIAASILIVSGRCILMRRLRVA